MGRLAGVGGGTHWRRAHPRVSMQTEALLIMKSVNVGIGFKDIKIIVLKLVLLVTSLLKRFNWHIDDLINLILLSESTFYKFIRILRSCLQCTS